MKQKKGQETLMSRKEFLQTLGVGVGLENEKQIAPKAEAPKLDRRLQR